MQVFLLGENFKKLLKCFVIFWLVLSGHSCKIFNVCVKMRRALISVEGRAFSE